MPSIHNPSDEQANPDFPLLNKDQSTTTPSSQPSNTQQSESRSSATPARPIRLDSVDEKAHTGARSSRRGSSATLPDLPTTAKQTSTDRLKAPSGPSNSNQESTSDGGSSGSNEPGTPTDPEQSSIPTSNPGRSNTSRLKLQAQAEHTSKDPQHPNGPTEDTSAKESSTHHPSAQAPPGNHPEEQHQTLVENKQSTPQASGYGRGVMAAVEGIMSFIPGPPQAPPKDKYQQLKEEFNRLRDEYRQSRATIENYDRELRRRTIELNKGHHHINYLQHENQRSKDTINGLQNELMAVHQQLDDAKALSEVRGKELFGAQVFLTKADTLSISEVGEKVTALNEEIFQAAATLGEALIHQRYEVSQKKLEEAAALSQEMVGEKLTRILIAESQKPEPEVNPLLVQVVLQIFMVEFCVSKIQSWYPGDDAIHGFLSAIYSEIRLTEEQAVSGRWRALTRAHTRPSIETWNKELYKELQSILIMASWAPRSQENQESYGNRLPSIFKAINELRMAIGEKFTSADLDIFVFECDKTYDHTIMEDAYGDGRQSGGKRATEPIVGTTGIGLGKVVLERSGKDVIQIHPLIPAKVVLTSTMKEALEPVQSNKSKKNLKKKQVETTDGVDQEGRNGSKSKANSSNMDTTG